MTIKIFNNKIQFGNYTLTESADGFTFNGTITANSIIDGFQGILRGYSSGGRLLAVDTYYNTVDSVSFITDGNATDAGDLSVSRAGAAGQSSPSSGYTSGGRIPPAPSGYSNVIDRFPFSSFTTATDVGDLTTTRRSLCGQSSSVSGYSSGGQSSNVIDKFPFASNDNATDVGDLASGTESGGGHSSSSDGYSASGFSPSPTVTDNIDKFPFATNTNASIIGNLTVSRYGVSGQSSYTHGYISGGAPQSNVIDKFPFASNANATDVGDLTVGRTGSSGTSSTSRGYVSGGDQQPTIINVIDKFSFVSDSNATDVGDLSVARSEATGQQV